jgi:ABC transporter substrate binding protein
MQRREFITLLGGAAVAWPLTARAQQPEQVRRIGVLMASAADDRELQARMAAFLQALQQLGWTDGRNLRIDTRWATTNADDLRRHAAELAALAPDVIVAAAGTATVAPLLQATRTVPIVFVVVIDPVGAGFVASLARPGGNATGFLMFEYGLSGKWLELLKQIAPGVTRAAVLPDPAVRLRDRAVRRPPGRGAVVGNGVEPGRRARCARNRARCHGIRALRQWRPDRDCEPVGDASSRSNRHAGGPAPVARGLRLPLLRHRRRPDFVRS